MPKSWAIGDVDLHLDVDATRVRGALERTLRDALRGGRLAPGTRLPSSRALARDLGLARNTVAAAYAQLVAEGWLEGRQGAGTRVALHPSVALPAPSAPPPHRTPQFDLRPGVPDLTSFPRNAWLAAARRALREAPFDALGYGDPRGRIELRRALAEYLARARGVAVSPERIVVCTGLVQGLSLVRSALATTWAAEEYGHAAHRRGLEAAPLPVDQDGAVVSELGSVGAVLLTPAHQFPLGSTLSPQRRRELVAWARSTGGAVVEDDYDGEFRYDRQPVGALQALCPDRVAYLGSTSKSLAQTLRLGWMVLPDDLIDPVIDAAGGAQFYVDAISQLTMADFITSGQYDRHIRRMRGRYRRRRDALVDALAGFDVGISGLAAGVNVLLTLPDGTEHEVLRRAGEAGVALQGLSRMRHPLAEADHRDGIIVGFGAPAEHAFAGAVEALCGVIRSSGL